MQHEQCPDHSWELVDIQKNKIWHRLKRKGKHGDQPWDPGITGKSCKAANTIIKNIYKDILMINN